jgi:hypothetical protein
MDNTGSWNGKEWGRNGYSHTEDSTTTFISRQYLNQGLIWNSALASICSKDFHNA